LPLVPVISIIDDDASVRIAVSAIVRSMDGIAYSFSSGREFLVSSQLNETSCIIADIQMPSMNGLELQRELSARGVDIPMIFITAYPDEKIRMQALDAGAVCFLNKPFDGVTIVGCIERALGRSG
jgi:FixJ family two-component response regulator